MRRLFVFTAAMLAFWNAKTATAHGPTFDYSGGKVVMLDEDGHPQGLPVFVYNDDLAFNFANLGWQSVDGGGSLVVGDAIGLTVLDGAPLLGMPTTQYLFFHDGSSMVDPGTAVMQALGTTTILTKTTLNAADIPLDSVGQEDGKPHFHAHLGMFLSNGATGAYAFWVQTTTSNPNVDPSDPYLVILNNSLDPASFQRAIDDFVDHAVVPEMSSVALFAGSTLLLGVVLAFPRRRITPSRNESAMCRGGVASTTPAAVVCCLVFGMGAGAWAHGPQIQITNDNEKITTRALHLDGPYGAALTDPKSVYVMPLLPTGGVYFSRPNDAEVAPGIPEFNSGPGIAFGIGQTFASGNNFSLTFTQGLKLWDGSTFSDPGAEQIQAFRGPASAPTATATTSDTGPFAVLNFPTISPTYTSESHNSASFRLLGDGVDPTSPSDDGVYLLGLQLLSTQTGLAPSDPYYFVLYKNVGLAEAMTAARSLGYAESAIQAVPETSAVGLMLVGALVAASAAGLRRRMARSK